MQPQQLMNAFPLPLMPDDQLDAPMTVQRWGALLVCHSPPSPPQPPSYPPSLSTSLPSPPPLIISHVSENVDAVLGYSIAELLSHPLSSILDRATVDGLREDADAREGGGKEVEKEGEHGRELYAQRAVALHSGVEVWMIMHGVGGGRYIVEALPVGQEDGYGEEDVRDSEAELRERLTGAESAALCAQHAVEVLNRLLRYDRCLVYRFIPPHHHGEVLAESLLTAPCAPLPSSSAPTMPLTMPFLGLRFPPHPLSPRVEAVYRCTAMRMVPDTIDTGAMLVTASANGSPSRYSTLVHLDLKHSLLRAISPQQGQQFLAIGVRAAATFVLFVHGRAWGALLWSVYRGGHPNTTSRHSAPSDSHHLLFPACSAHNSPKALSWRTVCILPPPSAASPFSTSDPLLAPSPSRVLLDELAQRRRTSRLHTRAAADRGGRSAPERRARQTHTGRNPPSSDQSCPHLLLLMLPVS